MAVALVVLVLHALGSLPTVEPVGSSMAVVGVVPDQIETITERNLTAVLSICGTPQQMTEVMEMPVLRKLAATAVLPPPFFPYGRGHHTPPLAVVEAAVVALTVVCLILGRQVLAAGGVVVRLSVGMGMTATTTGRAVEADTIMVEMVVKGFCCCGDGRRTTENGIEVLRSR